MRVSRVALIVAIAVLAAACRGVLKKEYEYEEELYLALDGSATVYVNASVPALVALRGLDLDVNPRARLDRQRIRGLFEAPGIRPRVSLSRRHGRRFVHVRVDAVNLAALQQVAPLSWSTYRLDRQDDLFVFRQQVGAASGRSVGHVGWTGRELAAFRIHLPSRIPFHNSPSGEVQRGNILEWEQPLTHRLRGVPLDIEVHMDTESILFQTLLLFGSTIVAAALAFGFALWWIARRGREADAVI